MEEKLQAMYEYEVGICKKYEHDPVKFLHIQLLITHSLQKEGIDHKEYAQYVYKKEKQLP